MSRPAARAGYLAACFVLLAGCGVVGGQGVRDIDSKALPQRLLASPAAPSASARPSSSASTTQIYFIRNGELTETARPLPSGSGPKGLQEVLDNLAAGPDAADRSRGLSTALPPATRLAVSALTGGLAVIDLSVDQPPPDQTTAVAQIVLTATSLSTVKQVRLTLNGSPFNAPLANGAQTDRPLTRDDFEPGLGSAD